MGYDDVIPHIGEFGRYQRRMYFLLCLPAITCAFHRMSGVFLAAKPDFRCLLPHENPENASVSVPVVIANFTYPWDLNAQRWSQCERFSPDLTNHGQHATDRNLSRSPSIIVKCDSFVYDKSEYQLTVTTELNLVCDRAWLRATSDSLFMVGMMLGSVIFGGLSDKYGRKSVFFLTLIIQLAGGILVAISPEIISYMIFRLIVGSTTSGVFLVGYVIALEMVEPKKRLAAGTGCQVFGTFGHVLTAGIAYFITNWRVFQIALTIPSIAFLAYWWLIPESVRWLLNNNRLEEAIEILEKASLENGKELSRNTLDCLLKNDTENKPDTEQPSVLDLLRYPNLRKKLLLLAFAWLVNSGTYYGLSWNTSNLGGNNYVNFVIAAAVELPAHSCVYFTLDRWGRKIIVCGCMLLAGTSLLCTLLVPADMRWTTIVLAMIGKFAITASYDAVYLFGAEQFPTVVRNLALGACSTSARIGGILAPYVNELDRIWTPLPFVIFGSCSLSASLLSFLLPETLNKKLPETIQDGEQFGKRTNRRENIERSLDVSVLKPLTTGPENIKFERED